MSKIDAQRAMREARYAERQARAQGSPRPRVAARPPVAPPASPEVDEIPDAADAAPDDRCGHRNMTGRTCTREAGHAATSHRYS